jgi:hypothetical protein
MIFLEIVIPSGSLADGRQALEDDLDDALQEAGLGEVTGGGSGIKGSNIDIEVTDVAEAVSLIRTILKREGASADTMIRHAEPDTTIYTVYD